MNVDNKMNVNKMIDYMEKKLLMLIDDIPYIEMAMFVVDDTNHFEFINRKDAEKLSNSYLDCCWRIPNQSELDKIFKLIKEKNIILFDLFYGDLFWVAETNSANENYPYFAARCYSYSSWKPVGKDDRCYLILVK